MAEIKAIPTRYNGYHFRSRLEARWAVFFDALGIKWEYEPEGYTIGKFINYLPDFYLKDFGVFIEIKPSIESNNKCSDFYTSIGEPIILCGGIPGENYMHLYSYDSRTSGGGDGINECLFSIDNSENVVICVFGENSEFAILKSDKKYEDFPDNVISINYKSGYIFNSDNYGLFCVYGNSFPIEIKSAYKKSRSARFEHGENGAT